MIDIYDELGYIKNVLSNGLSQKWERDATLLIRYYRMEGLSKKEVKAKIRQKCEEASKRPKNPIPYQELVSFKRLDKIIEDNWKKETPLRTIHEVIITKEVLEWFLKLEEEVVITDDEVEEYKKRRPGVSIKKNHPINWNRTKYLFTLYVWTKVQENYLDRPQVHYLKNFSKRFREDANLPAAFSLTRERNLLYDLGFIGINNALGVEARFIGEYEVFKIPVTEENKIVITTGEPPDGDLYRPGYWLEKQKMGSFVCKRCGKEFAHYSTSYRERARKYCKECAILVKEGKESKDTEEISEELKEKIKKANSKGRNGKQKKKKIDDITLLPGYRFCIECGNMYKLSSEKDRRSVRCPDCQRFYEQTLVRERIKKYREKKRKEILNKGGEKMP